MKLRTVGGHSFAASARMVGGWWPGVLGSDIAAVGDHGPSPYLNDSPDPAKYYRSLNVGTWSGYEVKWFADGSVEIVKASPGAVSHTYRLYENNVALTTATINVLFGSLTGTLAITEQPDTVSMSGTVSAAPVTGTLAITEQPDTVSMSGTVSWNPVSGSLTITEQPDTVAISGTVSWNPVTGTLAITEQPDTVSIIGSGAVIAGSLAITEQPDTVSMSGTVSWNPVTGALAITEQPDTVSMAGTLGPTPVLGTLTITEQPDTVAISGVVSFNPVTGDLVITEQPDTVSIIGAGTAVATLQARSLQVSSKITAARIFKVEIDIRDVGFSFAELKAQTRRIVHDTFSVPALYRDHVNPQGVILHVRWHNKIARYGNLIDTGYAEVLEGINRVIFDADELARKNVVLRQAGLVVIPPDGIGAATLALETRDPTTGPINVTWEVSVKK